MYFVKIWGFHVFLEVKLTCFMLVLDISEIVVLSVTWDQRIPLLMHFSLHSSFHSISGLLNSHLSTK